MTSYIAIDGDDVGRKLEYYTVTNQIEKLEDFFRTYQESMIWLEEKLKTKLKAKIIINGGDSLLAFCIQKDMQILDKLEELRKEFSMLSEATLSIGIGKNPRQAYFALKLAKASGKNRIEIFREFQK